MPAILGALGALLVQLAREYLPGILGRALLAFGIGFTAYELGMPALIAFIQSKVNAMGAVYIAYFKALGLDVVCTMILSALIAVRAQKVALSKLGGS